MNMADDNMALQHNVHGDFDEFDLEAQFDPEQLKTKEELADEKEAQNNDKKKPKIEDEPDMYDYIESKWDDIAGYVFNNERRVVWGDYEAWLATMSDNGHCHGDEQFEDGFIMMFDDAIRTTVAAEAAAAKYGAVAAGDDDEERNKRKVNNSCAKPAMAGARRPGAVSAAVAQ